MRFLKMFCIAALIALSAAAVRADSAPPDPKLIISKPGDPTCTGGVSQDPSVYTCVSVNSAANPFFVASLDTPTEMVWDGPGFLEDLFVSFLPGPLGTNYTCASVDIFLSATCSLTSVAPEDGLPTFGFEFFGSIQNADGLAPCDANGNCEGVVAILNSPEPNSMLLLLSLGLPALVFAKKRWNVGPTA